MPWNQSHIDSYHSYAKTYVTNYKKKIDCADLALAILIDFAAANNLPVKLKSYDKKWKWYKFDPTTRVNPGLLKHLTNCAADGKLDLHNTAGDRWDKEIK